MSTPEQLGPGKVRLGTFVLPGNFEPLSIAFNKFNLKSCQLRYAEGTVEVEVATYASVEKQREREALWLCHLWNVINSIQSSVCGLSPPSCEQREN